MRQLRILFCLIFLSFYDHAGCQMYGGEWMSNLMTNIDRMNSDLRQNIMSMNQQMQSDIQQQVHRLTDHVQQSRQGMSVAVGGNSYVVGSVPGVSKSVISGHDSDGQPYTREVEERVVGNLLYHTEKIVHHSLGITNEISYTLDLTDPNARPIMQENRNLVLPNY